DSGAVPIVRELGSIGASGDLIPLSTLARAVTGVGGRVAVRIGAEKYNSSQALKKIGLKPIPLQAKEGLALINGTSFSCAIAANATIAAKQLLSVSMVVQAILMTALKVDLNPFQSFVHDCKPHPGQAWAAKVIRDLVHPVSGQHAAGEMVQDRYSIRCFPQYCAPIVEGIARVGRTIQTEMNSISDNPLIHNSEKRYYQSGNFLGQYIGIAMDDLRRMIGLLAKHLDVQIASLVAPEFNKGLSASLVGNSKHAYNMGLKGLQICGNSIMPMLTYMGNPIVEHFPTHAEQFNQNINSMSWGAANLAWNSIKMFRQYLAVSSLFAVQAIDLRAKSELGHFGGHELLRGTCRSFYESVCQLLDVECQNQRPYLFDDVDRWLEQDVDVVANDLAVKDKLIPSVGLVSHEFAEFCGANL
ncbi:MAG: aromatic amino acid ammonia-lyase, partial [Planctomycetota bacterium]